MHNVPYRNSGTNAPIDELPKEIPQHSLLEGSLADSSNREARFSSAISKGF